MIAGISDQLDTQGKLAGVGTTKNGEDRGTKQASPERYKYTSVLSAQMSSARIPVETPNREGHWNGIA